MNLTELKTLSEKNPQGFKGVLASHNILVETYDELIQALEFNPNLLEEIESNRYSFAPQLRFALYASLNNLLTTTKRINTRETFASTYLFPDWSQLLEEAGGVAAITAKCTLEYDRQIYNPAILHPYIWYLIKQWAYQNIPASLFISLEQKLCRPKRTQRL